VAGHGRWLHRPFAEQPGLLLAVRGDRLRQPGHVPDSHDRPVDLLHAQVVDLVVIAHLAEPGLPGDRDRDLVRPLNEPHRVPSVGDDHVGRVDPLLELAEGHKRAVRAGRPDRGGSGLREHLVIGAERCDRADQPVKGPRAHPHRDQDS